MAKRKMTIDEEFTMRELLDILLEGEIPYEEIVTDMKQFRAVLQKAYDIQKERED